MNAKALHRWFIAALALMLLAGCHQKQNAAAPVSDTIDFVRLPAGRFVMGSPAGEPGRDEDESPAHAVAISRPFLLGRTEVTQAQWRRVMGENSSAFFACGDACPVEDISWFEAVDFCNRASQLESLTPCYERDGDAVAFDADCTGYRLPTEAEWEYAARAGAATALWNGPLAETECGPDKKLNRAGWYCGNSKVSYAGCLSAADGGGAACSGTHPAGEKNANPWGLVDMNGNVMEWVWDWHAPYPEGEVTNPRGPAEGEHRVLRGGGWRSLARHCRAANRRTNVPSYKMSVIGFRVARNAP
ncbi:MAG: formylglycine-generating enzyme family protein [Candidatus Lernaella stagnicola]|nr:formylglycine-generating enzyme family protein [Candidatus Lernaella stagnicola]